jgi:broad specificity phosphatase PhoE
MTTVESPSLRRTLMTLATFEPKQARALLGALLAADAPRQMGARKPRPSVALWQKHWAARQAAIGRFRSAIGAALGAAQIETMRKLLARARKAARTIREGSPLQTAEGTGAAADVLFDLERFRAGLLAELRDATAATLDEAGSQALREFSIDDPFSMPPETVADFLAERENKLTDVADELFDRVKATLQKGYDAGESTARLARRITEEFGEIEEGRAEVIAQTETAAAYGFARQEAMAQAGIEAKRWLTSGLPNVRQAHADAQQDERNQAVPVGEPFHVGGELLLFPGDPKGSPENVINCHCVALAVQPETQE